VTMIVELGLKAWNCEIECIVFSNKFQNLLQDMEPDKRQKNEGYRRVGKMPLPSFISFDTV
jgi:hypothetical protein